MLSWNSLNLQINIISFPSVLAVTVPNEIGSSQIDFQKSVTPSLSVRLIWEFELMETEPCEPIKKLKE